jgi:Haem-NO-binding
MKGVVFTVFMEFVEEQFGLEIADRIITESDLASEGAYTRVGTYDYQEMLELVQSLSQAIAKPQEELLVKFGHHLFFQLIKLHSYHLDNCDSAINLLCKIDDSIHVEVLKLYPEAELPVIDCKRKTGNVTVLHYKSKRPFADLAMGLIQGCFDHFNENFEIQRLDQSSKNETVFTLIKKDDQLT